MDVLWLTPEPPLPPYTGGRERARRMLEHVAGRHAVHLMTYATSMDAEGLAALRGQLAGLTALPYPARGQEYGGPMRAAVRRLRLAPHTLHAQSLSLWPAASAAIGPDGRRPRRVLDLFDAPARLRQRLLTLQPTASLRARLALVYLRWREVHALRQADAVIVTSAHDGEVLQQAAGRRTLPLLLVPNGVDLDYWQAHPAQAVEPATLIFPGALNYAPNIDAAHVLVEAVLPRVRAHVPAARVMLAGAAPVPEVLALARHNPHVSLCADVPDMRPLLARAALVVVPLRAGSGTRLKILQALAAGRAVVSTPLGAEGLDLMAGQHLSIAPLVEDFAAEVVRLLCEPEARAVLEAAGPPAAAPYAWARQVRRLEGLY